MSFFLFVFDNMSVVTQGWESLGVVICLFANSVPLPPMQIEPNLTYCHYSNLITILLGPLSLKQAEVNQSAWMLYLGFSSCFLFQASWNPAEVLLGERGVHLDEGQVALEVSCACLRVMALHLNPFSFSPCQCRHLLRFRQACEQSRRAEQTFLLLWTWFTS